MSMDVGHADPDLRQPIHDRVEAVEPRRIEGGAEEARPVRAVAGAPALSRLQRAEGGVPPVLRGRGRSPAGRAEKRSPSPAMTYL